MGGQTCLGPNCLTLKSRVLSNILCLSESPGPHSCKVRCVLSLSPPITEGGGGGDFLEQEEEEEEALNLLLLLLLRDSFCVRPGSG